MPDTTIEQGEYFTIYETAEFSAQVPYPAVTHADGDQNHGFADLTQHPVIIEQVPEAVGKPGLIALLKCINSDGSKLMTFGCENGVFHIDPSEQPPDGPTLYIGSYVDITFRDPDAANKAAITELAQSIVTTRQLQTSDWTNYALAIQQMAGFGAISGCFSLMLKIAAYGKHEEQAWQVFNHQCDKAVTVFEQLIS